MQLILHMLRTSFSTRLYTWITASFALATLGIGAMFAISVVIIPFSGVESASGITFFLLLSHVLALLVPYRLLLKFTKEYGVRPPIHVTVSIISWLCLGNPLILFVVFSMIHLELWAEVVGVYWQKKLAR